MHKIALGQLPECEVCFSLETERLCSFLDIRPSRKGQWTGMGSSPRLNLALAPAEESSLWRQVEPKDLVAAVPDWSVDAMPGFAGWSLIGASLRGRYHYHRGLYRDDAFAIGSAGGWNIIGVADGAGSARLSRVGAHKSVWRIVSTLEPLLAADDDGSEILRDLQQAISEVQKSLQAEAELRHVKGETLACTLLVLLHKPLEHHHVIITGQVGDGLIAAWSPKEGIQQLGKADVGQFAGETTFLTHISPQDIPTRVRSEQVPQDTKLLLVMSDGIGDDVSPPSGQLGQLIAPLGTVLGPHLECAKEELLQLINYERRGSFDDRTLVVAASSDAAEKIRTWKFD